jgi:hypothetical protein
VKAHGALDAPLLHPDLLEQYRERELAERPVHDQALSAALVVADHVDHGLGEARVLHLG